MIIFAWNAVTSYYANTSPFAFLFAPKISSNVSVIKEIFLIQAINVLTSLILIRTADAFANEIFAVRPSLCLCVFFQ